MRKFRTGRCAVQGLGLAIALLAADKSFSADITNSTGPTNNVAPPDPLLDLFVQKGFVTQGEADKVKAEADAMRTNGVAGYQSMPSKWKISDGVKSVELFGDVRLRYEGRTAEDPADNKISLDRWRYALRFGLKGELSDSFYYGFRMETSSNPRSPWVTFGTSSSGSVYQGPFGKSTAGLAIGQIYAGWRFGDWVDITLGKMPNPLYTTPMVWDTDLSPEGAAEKFKYSVGEADFFANFGQFLYGDFNPNTASSGLGVNGLLGQNTDNIFMFAWQGGVNYHITKNISAKFAATIYNYIGLQSSAKNPNGGSSPDAPYFGDPYVGEGAYYYYGGSKYGYAPGYSGYGNSSTYLPGYNSSNYPFNQVGLNNLLVLEFPFELNVKLSKVNVRMFGDFAYNLQGQERAQAAASAYSYILSQNVPPNGNAIPNSFPAQTHDVKAYQIGIGIGSSDLEEGPSQGLVYGNSSHRHDWEFRTYWQHVEQYSLDPNLIDSDFFEGAENLQGIYAAFAYAFSQNVIGTVRYGYASRINDQLGTGGTDQDIPQINPINHYSLFQVDLGVRF